ncbi:sarcosine oxidase subunit gamma [Frigidibacter sp. MR17.14]|uniref:sarcosine oxidase subunit gamma n=1 Tax=Frigidibacter sp. MR17.14 TaxID=3126509 RepID=UPI003012C4AA
MPDLHLSPLAPVTALGAQTARLLRLDRLTLAEVPDLGLASLALRRGTQAPAPFGLTLPTAGNCARHGAISAFWTGPDQWMIEGAGAAGRDFAAEVAAEAPGCSVTEETDGFAAFDVTSHWGEGPILCLLSRIANIDPARLAPGMAVRTGLDHMSVFVVRRSAEQVTVLGMRSAAGSLWHTLQAITTRVTA